MEAREAALAKAQEAIDAGTLRALKASEEMERRLKAAAIPVTFTRHPAPATRTSKGGDLDPSRPPPPSSPATPAQVPLYLPISPLYLPMATLTLSTTLSLHLTLSLSLTLTP